METDPNATAYTAQNDDNATAYIAENDIIANGDSNTTAYITQSNISVNGDSSSTVFTDMGPKPAEADILMHTVPGDASILAPGTVIKDYTIRDKIGAGGIGEVYRAWHNTLHTDVVVKRVKDEIRPKNLDNRLETKILVRVRHERLPRVYDFIETKDGIYTVMDYIDGKDLNAFVVDGESYSRDEIIRWGIQLCEAAQHLHTREKIILHKDIKPANVMLTSSRDIVLIDFNISSIFSEGSAPAAVSRGFSPPEQHAAGLTDERSDLYAIGATLYFLLTKSAPAAACDRPRGSQLFEGDTLDGLQAIINKATRTEPRLRFESAEAMRKALLNIPVHSGRYRKLTRLREICAIAFLTLTVAGAGMMFLGYRGRQTETLATYQELIQTAYVYNDSGDYEDALSAAEEARRRIPGRAEAYLQEARAQNGLGRYAECLAMPVNLSNNENPQLLSQLWYEKGYAAFALGDYRQAVSFYETAHDNDTSNGLILRELIRAYAYGGYTDQALELAYSLESGGGTRVDVLAAEIYLLRAQYADAEPLLRGVVEEVPSGEDEGDYWRAVTLYAGLFLNNDYLKEQKQQKLEQGLATLEGIKPFTDDKVRYRIELNEYLCELYTAYARLFPTNDEQYHAYIQMAIDTMLDNYGLGAAQVKTFNNLTVLYHTIGKTQEATETALEASRIFTEDYRPFMYLARLSIDAQFQGNGEMDFTEAYQYAETAADLYAKMPKRAADQNMEQLNEDVKRLKAGTFVHGGAFDTVMFP